MNNILGLIRQTALEFPSIKRVMLFGSRARGDWSDGSDYDIAVFGADENARVNFSDKIDELPTLHKIDVIFVNDGLIGKPIYDNILKDGVVIMDKFAGKLENYRKAVSRLEEGITETGTNGSLTLRDGVIQRFEFTTELAWKSAREYLLSEGETDINSPKPVMRAALRTGLIADEQGWIKILDDRNATSHMYDEEQTEEIFERIKTEHIALFKALLNALEKKENAL
ncbi:MAG: HI0074 family nucleotidyltransferase substrate-binding subunit [Ruminococcus sp.]|nr:HI0074 family nucleotidyltransferase substrate-binding subunit [Ruminococcus sp.]MCM1381321.1 HI0074 family nucleotidyltransferase substrate-binding subunit [Muribaculaceae bacterium]